MNVYEAAQLVMDKSGGFTLTEVKGNPNLPCIFVQLYHCNTAGAI